MLSIIIPTLNEEKYLPVLLESIKKQKFEGDYELIVADAGSQDKTVEIARNFGGKIVPGGLPAKGRNQGAAEARGDLFLFLKKTLLRRLFSRITCHRRREQHSYREDISSRAVEE